MKNFTNHFNNILKGVFAFLLMITAAQMDAQCDPPSATLELEVNNFIVQLLTGEDLFTTGIEPGYEIPAGSGVHPLFAVDFWIGGKSPDQQLKLAGGLGQFAESDYFSGPLTVNTATVDPETCGAYDQFAVCYLVDSELHLAYHDALAAGTDDELFPDGYITPDYFYNYPAEGPTEEHADYLAPFYDYDNDGSYNPDSGDCPLFSSMATSGEDVCIDCNALHGDVAVFWIDNDMGNIHSATSGDQIGVEIQNVWYAFYEDEGVLNSTSFLQKKIINRGTQTLEDFGAALFIDVDLGNPEDDYVGSMPSKNLGFVYNSDNADESVGFSNGYGANPPAFGVVMLNGISDAETGSNLGMTHFMYMENSSFSMQGKPQLAFEYYNYMTGFWRDGSPLFCGETGYMDGEEQTSFAFNHDLDEEYCSSIPFETGITPSDQSILLSSMGSTLSPGDEHCMTFAFIYQENDGEPMETVDALSNSTDEVIALFDDCFGAASSIDENIYELEAQINYDPILERINIKTDQRVQTTIVNSLGQLISSQEIYQNTEIPLGYLSSGMYIIHLQGENNQVLSKKIIIE